MQEKKYGEARNALVQIRQAMENKMVSAFIDEQLSALGS